MKKNYAKICAMLLSDMDFKLIKQPEVEGIQYYSLEDLQGANLGKIENDRFDNTAAVLDRLDMYYDNYILDDLHEIYGLQDVYSKSFEELLEECKNNQNIQPYYIDWLELITHQAFNVDINDVYKEQENLRKLSQMKIEGRPDTRMDFWVAVGDSNDYEYEHWIFHICEGTSDLSEEDDEAGYESYAYYEIYENNPEIQDKITEENIEIWKNKLKENDGGACMFDEEYKDLSFIEICYDVLSVAGISYPEQLKIRIIK